MSSSKETATTRSCTTAKGSAFHHDNPYLYNKKPWKVGIDEDDVHYSHSQLKVGDNKSFSTTKQGSYNTVCVIHCIVPIQYCNVMYCIPHFPDKVLFVHRSYVPRVCNYCVSVYNLQLFAKIIFCLVFCFWIPFVLYLFDLVDDIISDVNDEVISDITDNVIMHDVISDLSHHTAPKTKVSHPHPPGQANRSRLLSTLGGLANSPVGGMPPGEVRSGFLDTPQMLFSP